MPPNPYSATAKTPKEKRNLNTKVQEVIKLTDQVPHYPGRTIEGLVLRFQFEDGSCHRSKLKSKDYKR